jgi:hypothetical protein
MADKWKTMKEIESVVPTPKTFLANSKEEERRAIESITYHVENKYGSYVKYKVLIKPISETGGKGIQFVNNPQEVNEHEFPSLVQERIIPNMYQERVVDLRIFFVDGWISKPIARIAPEKFNDASAPLEKRLLTALCSGGEGIKVTEEVASIMEDYVLAASLALEKSFQISKIN